MNGVFADSKTFVDAVPRSSPDEIMRAYQRQHGQADFDLGSFVEQHFRVPDPAESDYTGVPAAVQDGFGWTNGVLLAFFG